jgi:hypothetical protein
MNKIEQAVRRQRCRNKPQRRSKTDHGYDYKREDRDGFHRQCMCRVADQRK